PADVSSGVPRVIAGWPFKHVRRALRQDKGDGLTLQSVARVFPRDCHVELPDVISRLQTLGYLKEQMPGWWRTTASGARLRRLSEGRFARERALDLVKDLRTRIRKINADSKYVWKIKTAVVFGSVLENQQRVGDVDVAVLLERRYSDDGRHKI